MTAWSPTRPRRLRPRSSRSWPRSTPSSAPRRRCRMDLPRSSRRRAAARRRRWWLGLRCSSRAAWRPSGSASSRSTGTPPPTSLRASSGGSGRSCPTRPRSRSARSTPSRGRSSWTPGRVATSSPIGCRCFELPGAGLTRPKTRHWTSSRRKLDTLLSAWKVEGREPPHDVRPILEAYADLLRIRGAVDFDDLVVRACELLETDARLRLRWQSRFLHVCVDEFQDVDAAQLRLVRLLAAPEDNLFVVGDDDQTIYAWRLADVRRILRFSTDYPDARRVMLATNYRCPPSVVAASARMVATNHERFDKPIRAPADARDDGGSISAWNTSRPDVARWDGQARGRRGCRRPQPLLPVADTRRADADPARAHARRRPARDRDRAARRVGAGRGARRRGSRRRGRRAPVPRPSPPAGRPRLDRATIPPPTASATTTTRPSTR